MHVGQHGNVGRGLSSIELSRNVASKSIDCKVTFGRVCDEWLKYIERDRRRRPSTLRDYRQVVRTHLVPEFGYWTPISSITPLRIDQYRQSLVADGALAPRTINKILRNLHGIFRRAAFVHGLGNNPVAFVERQPVQSSGAFSVLTPAQIEQLLDAAASGQDCAAYAVAAYAGLRVGEIRALRWEDVDVNQSVVRIARSFVLGTWQSPKSGRVRSVPLIPQASKRLLAIRGQRGEGDLVFHGLRGGVIDDSRLRRRFYEALRDAGLPHMRIHDLRHTFGSLAIRAFPLSDVAAFMGHADITTTMIYVHHMPRRDAASLLASAMAV